MHCEVCGRERDERNLGTYQKFIQREDGQWSLEVVHRHCTDDPECVDKSSEV